MYKSVLQFATELCMAYKYVSEDESPVKVSLKLVQ